MEMEIEAEFQQLGARVRVGLMPMRDTTTRAWNGSARMGRLQTAFRIDVARDDQGEFFDVSHRRDVSIRVLDLLPKDAHLLLQATVTGESETSEFLCGHDERSWFAAAIPETSLAQTVQQAKDALKPQVVWDSIREHGVPMSQRDRRQTAAFVRQGEWFFIPRSQARINNKRVLRNEPIRRGAGKPHTCQFHYRYGGEDVFVSDDHPNGLTLAQFRNWPKADRQRQSWQRMRRDAAAFVRGAIMHPDHDTIWLSDWHEVVMNRETEAAAMRHLAFLD